MFTEGSQMMTLLEQNNSRAIAVIALLLYFLMTVFVSALSVVGVKLSNSSV
jgi:hypothetical protein